jgi:DNA-binding NarL/FixJ family response regulator
MKLYLICNDNVLLEYWNISLHQLSPIVITSLPEMGDQEGSVVFMSDTMLSDEYDGYQKNKIMILSRIPDFTQAQQFLQKGAMGYGNAMMHEAHLLSTFQTLVDGNVWLHPPFLTKLILQVCEDNNHKEDSFHKLDVLSPREKEVALLLGEGKSHFEISQSLSITVRTIKAHSTSIYSKLGVKDRLALSLIIHT